MRNANLVSMNVKKYLLMCVCGVFFLILSMTVNKTQAEAMTQSQGVSWAQAQIGKGLDYDGVYGNQCVDLIKYYYAQFGVAGYARGDAVQYKSNALPPGWTRVWSNYQPGDIAVFRENNTCSVCSTGSRGHVGIITSIDSVGFNAVNQNYAGKSYCTQNWFHVKAIACAIRPNFSSSDSTPPSISNVRITNIDANGYTVTCNVSDNVGIDRVEFPSWNTDKHRGEDANWIRGSVSGNTASARISLSSLKSGAVQGNYVTHIYAWDTSGNKTGVSTSVIYIDRTAPTLTDVKIVEKDSQGYVVECKASDASGIDRVQFPTWTARNSQDDLAPNWGTNTAVKGTATGNTYRFRVNISDHNNEHGDYITHVYVYDKYGNSACASTHTKVIMGYVPQKIAKYGNSLLAVYDENASWESLKTIVKQMGSSLAEIPDAKKQAAVTDLVSDQYRTYYNIGGYQSAKGQPWKWLSGADVTYTNWNVGQPDCAGNNEFYMAVISGHGRWNDLPSNYGWSGFIVETPLDMKADAQMEYNGKIYKFYKSALPYATAERFCKETGGGLVKIETKEENDAIAQKIKEIKGSFYIGASDEKKEGTFVWRDGTALTYSNWSSGEPNNSEGAGAENYAVIYENGQWNDLYGWDATVGFIAEYDKKTEPVTTPTPASTVKPSSGNGNSTSSSKDTGNDQITQEDDDISDEDDEDNEIEKVSKGKVLWAKNLKKRKMKVKVKNLSTADYYEVVCGTNKACTKGKKKFSTSRRTVTFKRLKKKTYYVKVRGYYYHGKTKITGEWSKVKKVKIKK